MRQILLTFLCSLIFLASCLPQNLPAVSETSIALEDCALTSPSGNQVDARCGVLLVPEDRANSSGRKIELNIAVIPAINVTLNPIRFLCWLADQVNLQLKHFLR